ncbi:hypothetical protein [Corynebacterium sp. A21]|uniref:hypothetical protein n=1 Tax=Corynebacterium sp. A21 TaxID=3457318 RepID=UPI003FD2EF73
MRETKRSTMIGALFLVVGWLVVLFLNPGEWITVLLGLVVSVGVFILISRLSRLVEKQRELNRNWDGRQLPERDGEQGLPR